MHDLWEQLEPIILFAKIRHLLVHKGFPNPHAVPSEKARNIAKGHPFPAAEVRSLAERLREPKGYPELKEVHRLAVLAIGAFEKDFEHDFGVMRISKKKCQQPHGTRRGRQAAGRLMRGVRAQEMADQSGTTALIIGAGLSAASDFKLPTMRGFFGPELATRTELHAFLEWFYPGQGTNAYNLEEVMSFLHLSSTRLPLWRDRPHPTQQRSNLSLYESLLGYVKDRLEIPPEAVCALHQQLFETLSERDSIISFNYDLIADNALLAIEPKEHNRPGQDTRMGKISELLGRLDLWSDPPPSLMPREQSWGFYLKLHGSLDWLNCETEGCGNNANIFARSVSELSEGQEEGMPCRYCGASLKTFIVPPVATKRLKDTGRMAFLWNIALRQLINADRIVVIGISFAPSDFELRWLVRQAVELRTSPRYELHVVNPTSVDRQNIIAVFPGRDREVYEYELVSDYITKN